MKKRIITILFVLLVGLIACTSVASADTDTTIDYQIYGTQDYKAAQEVLVELNELRASLGLSQLKLDPTLTKMAMQRASECAVYFDHVRPDGTNWYTIIQANSSYYSGTYAENIAIGQSTASAVMNSWTNSSGHYTNMVNGAYKSVGIGCFYQPDGSKAWCQLFHTKAASSTETSSSKVYVNNIAIHSLLSNCDMRLEGYGDCAVNLYKGLTIEPRLFVVNPQWSSHVTFLSGGYSLRSNNTACATTSGKKITAVGIGSVTIDYVFNSGYIPIPYRILENPELWSYIDDNGDVVIVSEGYLDTTSNNVQVYFKEANDDYWTLTNINNSKTTYTITNAQYGDVYTCVARYYDYGQEKWVEVSDRLIIKKQLSTPKASVSTIATSGKPKLTWNKVEGANKYEVWRAVGPNGTYEKFYTTTSTSMLNDSATPGTTYYYKVKAICERNSSCNSSFSSRVYITCDLPQPKNVKVAPVTSTGKPRVTWDKVTGASKYELYRAVGPNGTYKKYDTTTGTSYTNTSTTPGTIYYYKVKAICGSNSNANSALSNKVYMACDLAQPTNVKITTVASSGKPKVTWNAVNGASKYEVWRKVGSSGTYKKYDTTTGTSYTNTSTTPGTIYYYKIKAICGSNSGGNSALSKEVYIACDLAQPKATIKLNSSGKPVVSWNKVSGATKYEVWRAVGPYGTYEKFYTTTNLYMTNTSAKKGTTYFYKVKAICGSNSGGNSALSNKVYITSK